MLMLRSSPWKKSKFGSARKCRPKCIVGRQLLGNYRLGCQQTTNQQQTVSGNPVMPWFFQDGGQADRHSRLARITVILVTQTTDLSTILSGGKGSFEDISNWRFFSVTNKCSAKKCRPEWTEGRQLGRHCRMPTSFSRAEPVSKFALVICAWG